MDVSYFDDSVSTSSGPIQFDFRTFLVTIGLVGIGLISIYSATYDAGASAIFKSQLVYAIGGLAAMLAIAFVPQRCLGQVALGTGLARHLFGLDGLRVVNVAIPDMAVSSAAVVDEH